MIARGGVPLAFRRQGIRRRARLRVARPVVLVGSFGVVVGLGALNNPVGDRTMAAPLIALFTDFGSQGPYLGQVKTVLYREAPTTPVVDLFSDAPSFDPRGSAYLLAPYAEWFPRGTVFLCIVDPGVGGDRPAVVLEADGRWFIGPDNGLFNEVARRADQLSWWDIEWRPSALSSTFHGRDLFAPVAARVARGEAVPGALVDGRARIRDDWPKRWPRAVYIDHYGNVMCGVRAAEIPSETRLAVNGRAIERAVTFGDVLPFAPFWYANANGLVEIAVNRGRADRHFGLVVGDEIGLEFPVDQ